MSREIIERYFAAFNAGDGDGMLALVSDDVEHHVNQGDVRHGRAAFAEFCAHMGVSYREELRDMVIFVNDDGTRAAAEFTVHGEYLQTDPGLPEARGQRYVLPAGSFFALKDGKITRVTTYYNLQDWIAQVSA
ncbi:nuclear transport factor 2 family protein [Rhodobacteraceae bacterium 2376]|uniref:Nuclear transport factor 2 family protein n=1 Tax=Rhabdonatronobacter sediminivivens TaxID=2743469 RepID=A0A7Z0KZE7_9RHOB|nr:ketosteroid isomerase-related protein [Rhabdonatronobacter sediminivivens]NYS26632.1 nuclear transport factor 2 family protein [Rhabdonatronobacter sediminivivens]